MTCPRTQNYSDNNLIVDFSDSFTILGLWVLGLAVSNINESRLQTYESKTLFLMTSLQYYCIPGLAEIKTYVQKMQDAQVTKSLGFEPLVSNAVPYFFTRGHTIFNLFTTHALPISSHWVLCILYNKCCMNFQFSVNMFVNFHIQNGFIVLMTNSLDPDQLASPLEGKTYGDSAVHH